MADSGEPVKALHNLIRSEIRTSVIGEVVRYNAKGPTADVTFLVLESRNLADGRQEVPAITVPSCPVIWPIAAAGTRAFTMGLNKGDRVQVSYRHQSHGEIDGGATGPLVPGSQRRMSPSDVVVIPGYRAPATGLPAGSYRDDGQPVLAYPAGEAFHAGDSTADLELGVAEKILDRLNDIHAAVSGHTHLYTAPLHPVVGPQIPTGAAAVYTAPASVGTPRILVDE